MKGFNGTIFAYGQTSSGKTYTMLGVDRYEELLQVRSSCPVVHTTEKRKSIVSHKQKTERGCDYKRKRKELLGQDKIINDIE